MRRLLHRGAAAPLVAAAAVLLGAALAAAQTPFALVNVGPDVSGTDARMAGRGGWGLAESDTLIPAVKNPAGLVPLTSVVILLNGFGESRSSETTTGERTTRRVLLPNVRVAIPLAEGRLALSAGFRLLRATDYETSRRLTRLSGPDTLFVYDEQFVREGSHFDLPLGASYQVSRWLSVSAGADIVRGSIREILDNDFISPPDYRTAALTQEDDLSGTAASFGLRLQPHPRLSLGAVYRTAHDLTVDRRTSLQNVAATADTTFVLEIPERWGVGAALRVGERWQVGADWELQPWSRFAGRDDWAAAMRDETTLSVGVERRQADRRDGGWANLPLRAGATFRRWGYALGDHDIRERTFWLGTGFGFRDREGHVDVALGRGWVGDLAEHGIEDSYWRLAVSVAGMERWW